MPKKETKPKKKKEKKRKKNPRKNPKTKHTNNLKQFRIQQTKEHNTIVR